jgi:hypothetical protein
MGGKLGTGEMFRVRSIVAKRLEGLAIWQPRRAERTQLFSLRLHVRLNGAQIQDVALNLLDQPTNWHAKSDAPSVKNRPQKGPRGLPHLRPNNAPLRIRATRSKELAGGSGGNGEFSHENTRKYTKGGEEGFARRKT